VNEAHDRIFGRYHVCPACLSTTLRIGRTKHDTLYTTCDRCRTRSFHNSVDSLIGLALLDDLVAFHHEQVKAVEAYRAACDATVERFKEDLRLALRDPQQDSSGHTSMAEALDMHAHSQPSPSHDDSRGE
jgi:hypothetical protein